MANNGKPELNVVKSEKLTVDERITIKELEEKIDKMIEDRDAKCKAAKEQLVNMIDVTVDKYLTATGTAEALRVLRFAIGEESANDIRIANSMAHNMAGVASRMADKAKDLPYNEMDQLCDSFYRKDFIIDEGYDLDNLSMGPMLAFEMMCIDLCRNVGGAAEDMVSFIERVEEELEATKEALAELKGEVE